jgi:LacI family transcriptional regulator
MACGPEDHYFSKDMLAGYESAHHDAGVDVDPSLIFHGGFRLPDGQEIIRQAVRDGMEFDAVFSTDMMACGAVNALKESGRSIPGDLAVAGFDGLAIGQAITPSLTTVVADRDKMGRLAVQRIREAENCAGDEGRFLKLSLFPELAKGASSVGVE